MLHRLLRNDEVLMLGNMRFEEILYTIIRFLQISLTVSICASNSMLRGRLNYNWKLVISLA